MNRVLTHPGGSFITNAVCKGYEITSRPLRPQVKGCGPRIK